MVSDKSVLTHYLTGGLGALLKWWLDYEMPYSPQEMNDLFQQMAMPGIRAVMKKQNRPNK